jgi:hypothetical protein
VACSQMFGESTVHVTLLPHPKTPVVPPIS